MVRSLSLWDTGGHVVTPYAITVTAYPGEFFIHTDPEYPFVAELEKIKDKIRSERAPCDPIKDPAVGRYCPVEVARFLNLSRRWV